MGSASCRDPWPEVPEYVAVVARSGTAENGSRSLAENSPKQSVFVKSKLQRKSV